MRNIGKYIAILLLLSSIVCIQSKFAPKEGFVKDPNNFFIDYCIPSTKVVVGGTAKLQCFPGGSQGDMYWNFKKQYPNEEPSYSYSWKMPESVSPANSQKSGQHLTIPNAETQNSGSFMCTARAKDIEFSYRHHLVVSKSPKLKYMIKMEEKMASGEKHKDCTAQMQSYNEQNPEPIEDILCKKVEECTIDTTCAGKAISHILKVSLDFEAFCDDKCLAASEKKAHTAYHIVRMNMRVCITDFVHCTLFQFLTSKRVEKITWGYII